MKLMYAYFRYRFVEIMIWCGIPFAGAFFADMDVFSMRSLLFCIALLCAMSHVLILNDWGGLKRNPKEIERYGYDDAAIVPMMQILRNLSVMSLAGFILLEGYVVGLKPALFFGISVFVLNMLYSHPAVYLKESLIGSKIIHYLFGQLQFSIGYLSFSDDLVQCAYLSVFFALVLLGGHFIHESTDKKEDQGNSRTWATVFDVQQTARVGWFFFVLSHIYWVVLFYLNIIHLNLFLLFSMPLVVHVIHVLLKDLEVYRCHYRIIYGTCILVYVCQKF